MPTPPRVVGVLLAAGSGTRYGGDKLLAKVESDPAFAAIGELACRNLRAAIADVVAVVRPDDPTLAALLEPLGARIVRCANADRGMGASLACGVAASADAAGWVVALGDMPWILPSTIASVAHAIENGASIAAPICRGERGHPVGFAARLRDELMALDGDEGARAIIAAHTDEITLIDVDDPGIRRDVDTPI